MSERGVFAVDRGLFDHPMFAREPYTEREAWIWLVGAAAWRPHRVRVAGRIVDLKRGQCAYSVRFLAEKWSWSKSRVARFLDRLENETMIGTQSGTGATIITICKYDDYQKVALPERDTAGTLDGTLAGQQRDKEESIQSIESPEADASAAPAPDVPLVPVDARTDLFRRGLQTLARITGKTPDGCRSLVGQWLKIAGDEAIHVTVAIEDAERNRIADPVPWIRRKLESLGRGQRAPPSNPDFLEIQIAHEPRQPHGAAEIRPAHAGRAPARVDELDFGTGISGRR